MLGVLYLPLDMKPDQVFGRYGFLVRCRIEQRRPEQGMYTESPRIVEVAAYALGAAVPATHAVIVENEYLGLSDGEAGKTFQLQNTPILDLIPDETVEVEERQHGEIVFVP